MVTVVQLVRASDCGSECRGFESHRSPFFKSLTTLCCEGFFCLPAFSPSLCFPPAQPRCDKPPVAAHSRCVPFPRVSPLLSPRSAPNGLHPSGKCRPPTCPLAHVSQCPWLPITLCPASSSYAKRGKASAWVGSDAPAPMRFSKDCRDLSKRTFPRARERVRTPHFFVFCLHPSPACVRRSKSNRCGEEKGEGLCSPLPSPLCGSRLDCCGFWHEGRHVFDQSPLLFPHFRAVFPVRVE